jgi:hypothetical protein
MASSGQLEAERRVRQGAVPTVPGASARFCYGLHRIVEKSRAWTLVARTLEAHPRAYQVFTALEKMTKEQGFGCRMCGQCALPMTGYACPMTCPKQLRNGPCGGVGADGGCEVYPEVRCVWLQGYERAKSVGHSADFSVLQRPIDHRRFGESSWVNYWSGRDDYLAAAVKPGDDRPSPRLPASPPAA